MSAPSWSVGPDNNSNELLSSSDLHTAGVVKKVTSTSKSAKTGVLSLQTPEGGNYNRNTTRPEVRDTFMFLMYFSVSVS